jgi:hypothetical protein
MNFAVSSGSVSSAIHSVQVVMVLALRSVLPVNTTSDCRMVPVLLAARLHSMKLSPMDKPCALAATPPVPPAMALDQTIASVVQTVWNWLVVIVARRLVL